MKDYSERERKEFIKNLLKHEKKTKESNWWWTIGVAAFFVLSKLVMELGPLVFPNLTR